MVLKLFKKPKLDTAFHSLHADDHGWYMPRVQFGHAVAYLRPENQNIVDSNEGIIVGGLKRPSRRSSW
jgi:hypothetical protein